jgi:hypothetical protein
MKLLQAGQHFINTEAVAAVTLDRLGEHLSSIKVLFVGGGELIVRDPEALLTLYTWVVAIEGEPATRSEAKSANIGAFQGKTRRQ